MTINRNLAIALIIKTLLKKDEESLKEAPSAKHLLEKVSAKIDLYMNGNKALQLKFMKIIHKKKKNFRDVQTIKEMEEINIAFRLHEELINKALIETNTAISVPIAIPMWIRSIMREVPEIEKFCRFEAWNLYNYKEYATTAESAHFTSFKVAKILLEKLDKEIEKYYESEKETA